jgi:hypothetical protein
MHGRCTFTCANPANVLERNFADAESPIIRLGLCLCYYSRAFAACGDFRGQTPSLCTCGVRTPAYPGGQHRYPK